MPGRMTKLMERGAMPVDSFEIGLRRWDLHVVLDGDVERTITADTKIDVRGLDECFNRGLDQPCRRWRRCGCELVGHFVALVAVKDGEPFEEWNRLRFFAGFGGTSLLVGRHETIGVDYRRAAF